MSWILSLGAGKEQIPLLKAIHAEGHKTAAVDIRADAEGVELCDAFRQISNRDVEGALAFAEWAGVRAVMVAASEVADVGAIIAHRLRLPGISVATALACKDKLQQKRVLLAAGVPCTEPHVVHRGAAQAIFDQLGRKVVVKPRRGSGSRGVTYVDNPMELPIAIQAAEEICPDVLMERYEPGQQLSVESFAFDGSYGTPCVVDRWYPPGRPVFKEVGGSWPSVRRDFRIVDLAGNAMLALGIQRGTFKMDVVLTSEGPKLIEGTPRLSGGPLASFIKDGAGVDYLRQAVRVALGEAPEWASLCWKQENKIARLMDGTDVPWNERERYLCPSPTIPSR